MPSPNETTAADAAVSSVGSLASSQTRRRPFHSFDGPPTVSSTIEPGIALAVDSVIVTVALVALTAIMGGADIMAARVYKLVTGMRT